VLELGYALSSEEHGPCELVDQARRAEEVGFSFALISDHFHPWVSRQGQSPFVWSVIGAIAQATDRIRLGTGVTCPIRRFHPALAAHAAATAAAMMPGRFFLGVGSGEHLNEHIFGEAWPPPETRLEMLEEAIGLIRALWSGESTSRSGAHFRVDEAQIYTLPEAVPPIYVAASGPSAASLAARVGDGLIATSPDADLVEAFRAEGGRRKPRFGQLTVCYDQDPERAERTAHEFWPTAGLKGEGDLKWELKTPELFEQLVANVSREDVAESILCSADSEAHLAEIRKFADAGFDHVYVHQVGPRQEEFFRFYENEVLPKLR
jgi:G6PDH family F420-dependent oxidoreductase